MSQRQRPVSTREHWSDRWREGEVVSLVRDPKQPAFRDMHALFRRHLPSEPDLCLLEVGCYPGKFLWYFNHYFGYRVAGLENVPWCCTHARELLAANQVDAEIIEGDLLTFDVAAEKRWDIVTSFGLIEHFDDTAMVIDRHLALLKPGGYLAVSAPNHQGIYGRILARISPEKHRTHNLMSYRDLARVLEARSDIEILGGGYLGRFGFWNTGLYAHLRQRGKLAYRAIRFPLFMLERLAQRGLPNSAAWSPNFAVVARRTAQGPEA